MDVPAEEEGGEAGKGERPKEDFVGWAVPELDEEDLHRVGGHSSEVSLSPGCVESVRKSRVQTYRLQCYCDCEAVSRSDVWQDGEDGVPDETSCRAGDAFRGDGQVEEP
jgi:hypothetical protein